MTSRLEVPAAPRSGESAPGVFVDVLKQGQAGRQRSAQSSELYTRFVWGVGIECSFIPHLNVDQFEWTQHDRVCRDDLRLAKDELGASALRYAFPWHKIETSPGKFDFSLADDRMAELERLGIEPYIDVMHFGTPLWLKQAAGDPEFPEALERFTTALVEQLGFRVVHVTGDVLVPIADKWTKPWAAVEERGLKRAVRAVVARVARGERSLAPWLEVYARAIDKG